MFNIYELKNIEEENSKLEREMRKGNEEDEREKKRKAEYMSPEWESSIEI